MNEAYAVMLRKTHTVIWLFLGMLLYKFSLDLGYLYLVRISPGYNLVFNPLKYAAGLVWCILLFVCIRHTERKSSSFFLYFVFLLQIVPISTVYAMMDESTIYYHLLCVSFLLCELLVGYTGEPPLFRRNFPISRAMTLSFAVASSLLIVYVIRKNGTPNLSLLDVYSVYDYRRSGKFQISKYMSYMLDWTTKVFLPFGIAKALTDRKYPMATVFASLLLLIYLYTGHKVYLFAIPLLLIGTLWTRRKNGYQELFLIGCVGFSALTLLANATQPGSLWYKLFGLFGNRVLLLSSKLKFNYFSSHPKMGLYAVFPRWIFPISSYYENIDFQHEIGAIYYGAPDMNANTGFFAEGYLRFGHIGTILILLLFALLLKEMDRFQERVGYQLTIGVFLYPIYFLADGHLFDTLILGPWMFLVAILLFYTLKPSQLSNFSKEETREHPSKISDSL